MQTNEGVLIQLGLGIWPCILSSKGMGFKGSIHGATLLQKTPALHYPGLLLGHLSQKASQEGQVTSSLSFHLTGLQHYLVFKD